ncbi:MAG: transposase, partial [Candidatus Hydrogenedentota bacterium]
FHKFLNQYVWSIYELAFVLIEVIIKTLNIKEPLTFALDDTLIGKKGKHIFGCGIHFNHSAKQNESKYIYGHNWVFISLIHFSTLVSKWLCFPILAQLYIPQKYKPYNKEHISRIDIAIQILRKIKERIKSYFIIVADAFYAKEALLKHCISNGIIFISRLRIDAVLYPKCRKRGRPRKYGIRLPSLMESSKRVSLFKRYTLFLYGKKVTISLQTFTAYWKPAASIIRVLIVKYPNKKGITCFFCTESSRFRK